MNRSSPYAQAMAEAAKQYLSKCIEDGGGTMAGGARIAGLNRTHFYKLCDQHQIRPVAVSRPPTSAFSNPLRRGNAYHRGP